MSRPKDEDFLLCHECWTQFFFEEIAWYEPMTGTALPEFYKANTAGYVCPLCDTPLDEENLKEFKSRF